MFDYYANMVNMGNIANEPPDQNYGLRTDLHALTNSKIVLKLEEL